VRRKNFTGVEMRVACESVVADSLFLIDSGRSIPLRKASCAKFFCSAHRRAQDAAVMQTSADARDFSSCAAFARAFGDGKKVLISSRFLAKSTMRAHSIVVHARNVTLSKTCALKARLARRNARRVHVSLSRTLFFSSCCSKRNAVRVDSRRALMRHPPCFHG
jgi:hypothetical protein